MAVITPPDLTQPPVPTVPVDDLALPPMRADITTALITRSPLSIPDLRRACFFNLHVMQEVAPFLEPAARSFVTTSCTKQYRLARERLMQTREAERLATVVDADDDLPKAMLVGR